MSRGILFLGVLFAVVVVGGFAAFRAHRASEVAAEAFVATSEAFPCVDHGCCCQTLAQCASRCCCFHGDDGDEHARVLDVSTFGARAEIVARALTSDDEQPASRLVPPRCGGRTPAHTAVSGGGSAPVLSFVAIESIGRDAFAPRESAMVDLRPDSRRPAPSSPPPRAASRIV